jgi:hypothetical protein
MGIISNTRRSTTLLYRPSQSSLFACAPTSFDCNIGTASAGIDPTTVFSNCANLTGLCAPLLRSGFVYKYVANRTTHVPTKNCILISPHRPKPLHRLQSASPNP